MSETGCCREVPIVESRRGLTYSNTTIAIHGNARLTIVERLNTVQPNHNQPWECRELAIVERLNTVQLYNSHPWECRELAVVERLNTGQPYHNHLW